MSDYRRATGFEALMGYLYLTDQFERILELAKEAIRHYNVKTGKKNRNADGKHTGRKHEDRRKKCSFRSISEKPLTSCLY